MNPVLLVLAVSLAAPGPKEPPKKDVDPLHGEWVIEKAEISEQPFPVRAGEWTMEFKAGGKLISRERANAPEEWEYTANPKKDPPEIDIIPAARRKSPNMIGIYKVEVCTFVRPQPP
jgi:uncharacterized protein (TIGR03067 family)